VRSKGHGDGDKIGIGLKERKGLTSDSLFWIKWTPHIVTADNTTDDPKKILACLDMTIGSSLIKINGN
jgi:hypothetical protein